MNYDQHLSMLNCDRFSSLEEIKFSFKTLSKKHHPDVGGLNENFIKLYSSYEYVVNNFKAPKKKYKVGKEKYYRVLDNPPENIIHYPVSHFAADTTLFFMLYSKEYRILINEKTELPVSITVEGHKMKLVNDER